LACDACGFTGIEENLDVAEACTGYSMVIRKNL